MVDSRQEAEYFRLRFRSQKEAERATKAIGPKWTAIRAQHHLERRDGLWQLAREV